MAFARDGTLATGDLSGRVRLWSAEGEATYAFSADAAVTGVAFTPRGEVAVCTADGLVRVWSRERNAWTYKSEAHDGWARAVACGPSGRLTASVGEDSALRVHQLDADRASSLVLRSKLHGLALGPGDGSLVIIAQDSGFVRLLDWRQDLDRALYDHHASVTSVAIDPTGFVFASGSADRTVELRSLRSKRRLFLRGHTGEVSSLCFSPQGDVLASGGGGGRLFLWSVADGKQRAKCDAGARIRGVTLDPAGERVACATVKGVKVWSTGDGVLQHVFPGSAQGVAFSPQRATAGRGGQ